MYTTKIKFVVLFVITALMVSNPLVSQNTNDFDKLLNSQYNANEPGASVLIAKNGKPIYRKAEGQANLELDVPLKPENVFEIGSITKQFTAVSILMLEEQGKLKIEDDITKYIPDYPTNGKKITIHHLLNH
ncbi:MAG: serine hydrolase domain-containing protein, partial [Flavobacteriaceae bacterium]|nr:serine hydrolase domain-containing protein [Flavobacteriaceae bacterium]